LLFYSALSDERTGLNLLLLLVLASVVPLRSESRRTQDLILLSKFLRLPQPGERGQVPVFICPKNRMAQLYPWTLCSLSVASYDSQGLRWRYSNLPPHGEEWNLSTISYIEIQFVPHRKFISFTLQIQPGHWGPITIHYRLIWDCVLFLSPLTTHRDYGGGILTRLHTGINNPCQYNYSYINVWEPSLSTRDSWKM
jgi:hypothetical protein